MSVAQLRKNIIWLTDFRLADYSYRTTQKTILIWKSAPGKSGEKLAKSVSGGGDSRVEGMFYLSFSGSWWRQYSYNLRCTWTRTWLLVNTSSWATGPHTKTCPISDWTDWRLIGPIDPLAGYEHTRHKASPLSSACVYCCVWGFYNWQLYSNRFRLTDIFSYF